jgi:hypothetical protein
MRFAADGTLVKGSVLLTAQPPGNSTKKEGAGDGKTTPIVVVSLNNDNPVAKIEEPTTLG